MIADKTLLPSILAQRAPPAPRFTPGYVQLDDTRVIAACLARGWNSVLWDQDQATQNHWNDVIFWLRHFESGLQFLHDEADARTGVDFWDSFVADWRYAGMVPE